MLESGRSHKDFHAALTAVIKQSWEYREVLELPPEAHSWRNASAQILKRSRPAQDLTLADEELILDAANSDWNGDAVFHYCVRGQCRFKCNGNGVVALRAVTSALIFALGNKLVVALLYRWKGFEQALAWVQRGRFC